MASKMGGGEGGMPKDVLKTPKYDDIISEWPLIRNTLLENMTFIDLFII